MVYQEKKDENATTKFVQLVNKHIAYKIKPDDIHRSHRLGRYTSDKDKNPRPIIARFFDETKNISLYKSKKGLKGKGLTLSENLTIRSQILYKKAKTVLGIRNVWTSEGRIIGKDGNNHGLL